MKKYIQPEIKFLNIKAESLMESELIISSNTNNALDSDEILSNEDCIWDTEEHPKRYSVWE